MLLKCLLLSIPKLYLSFIKELWQAVSTPIYGLLVWIRSEIFVLIVFLNWICNLLPCVFLCLLAVIVHTSLVCCFSLIVLMFLFFRWSYSKSCIKSSWPERWVGTLNSVCQQSVKVLPHSLENYSAIAKTLLKLHTLLFFTSPKVT